MPRHGQDRPRHGRAQVRLQDVQDVLHRREAQRRGHRIDDGVEAVVEGRMVPCGEAHGQELGQLLAAGNDHEVVQQQIPHGRAPQRRARRPRCPSAAAPAPPERRPAPRTKRACPAAAAAPFRYDRADRCGRTKSPPGSAPRETDNNSVSRPSPSFYISGANIRNSARRMR